MNRGERIREWVAAERFAVLAEEMVRVALRHKAEGRGDGPSDEILRIASEQRASADTLLRTLLADAQKKNDGR